MTTYAERLAPHQNFNDKREMDEQVTKHLQHIGYKLNDTDRKLLNHIRTHAVRYPGAFQQLLETIANAIDKSVPTAKRSLAKLIKLGIIVRKKTRKKNNSRAGATIYQVQSFSLSSEPMKVNPCNLKKDYEKPCGSKIEGEASENKPFISLDKSLKDTNTTKAPDQQENLKNGLLSKLPNVLTNAIRPFMDSVEEIYQMVGTIFRAKSKIDKSVKIEDHEQSFYKSIVSVFESQKRAAKKEKPFNVFAVMYKAILETTSAIMNPVVTIPNDDAPVVNTSTPATKVQSKELIPQFMIDDEQDPVRKAQLTQLRDQQTKEALLKRSTEYVPDFMKAPKIDESSSVDDNDPNFFLRAQAAFRERLAASENI